MDVGRTRGNVDRVSGVGKEKEEEEIVSERLRLEVSGREQLTLGYSV